MQHPDEGTIHAWLDDALPAEEARAVELHVTECAACAAAVAEARGLIAASSRILSALDDIPAGVLPGAAPGSVPETTAPSPAARPDVVPLRPGTPARRRFRVTPGLAAAAVLLLVAGTTLTLSMRRSSAPMFEATEMVSLDSAAASRPFDARGDGNAAGAPAPSSPTMVTTSAAPAPSPLVVAPSAPGEVAANAVDADVATAVAQSAAPPRAAGRRQGFAGGADSAPALVVAERTASSPPPPQATVRETPVASETRALASTQARLRGAIAGQAGAGAAGPVPPAAAPATAPTLADAAKVAASERGVERAMEERTMRADESTARERDNAGARAEPVATTGSAASNAVDPRARRAPLARATAAATAASFAGCWELTGAMWLDGASTAPRRFQLTTDSTRAGYVARVLPAGATGTWTIGADVVAIITLPGWPMQARVSSAANGAELRGGGVTARRTGC